MKRYLLDTNTVSQLIKGHSAVARRVVAVPMASFCIPAIYQVNFFSAWQNGRMPSGSTWSYKSFCGVSMWLPWDSAIAKHYGTIRADMERQGKILAQLDLLNATHALSVGAVMMINDQAFCHVVDLFIEDWTMHPMHGE